LDKPTAIAIDASGNLFFFNQGPNQILKITQSTNSISEPFIEQFLKLSSSPSHNIDIAVDSNKNLWVIGSQVVTESQSIQVVSIDTGIAQNISLPPASVSLEKIAFKPDGSLASSSSANSLVLSFGIIVLEVDSALSLSTESSTFLAAPSTLKTLQVKSMLIDSILVKFKTLTYLIYIVDARFC
jgi:hypothetical protein